jgi:hypothetical protein
LTPAYSVKLVRAALADLPLDAKVIDPFSGSGTTGLSAAEAGLEAKLVDVNPFLIWFAQAKTRKYASKDLEATLDTYKEVALRAVLLSQSSNLWQPSMFRIDRWWADSDLTYLRGLRAALDEVGAGYAKDLLLVAFCRTLIVVSNAAFNHQSMSFKARDESPPLWSSSSEESVVLDRFAQEVSYVVDTARTVLRGEVSVEMGDSRTLDGVGDGEYNMLYTSPPYANRMSYIRELRPYMYWLRFIDQPREAGELDWKAIGGTWGIATSRLMGWDPAGDPPLGTQFKDTLTEISGLPEKNAPLLAQYIRKYFHDMWMHFLSARRVLAPHGKAIYVVGNSTFFGRAVPTQEWYSELMRHAGFKTIDIQVLRKRNSKKELFEYAVTGSA